MRQARNEELDENKRPPILEWNLQRWEANIDMEADLQISVASSEQIHCRVCFKKSNSYNDLKEHFYIHHSWMIGGSNDLAGLTSIVEKENEQTFRFNWQKGEEEDESQIVQHSNDEIFFP